MSAYLHEYQIRCLLNVESLCLLYYNEDKVLEYCYILSTILTQTVLIFLFPPVEISEPRDSDLRVGDFPKDALKACDLEL